MFASGTGARLQGSLNISAIPGIDQQLPIVNLPSNQLGVSTNQLGGTVLVGATVPLYDGGSRAALLEQARDKVDKAETTLTQIRNEAVRQIIVARNTLKTSLSAYVNGTGCGGRRGPRSMLLSQRIATASNQSPTLRLLSVSFWWPRTLQPTPTAQHCQPRRHLPWPPASSDPHQRDEWQHGCSIPFGSVGAGRNRRWRVHVGSWRMVKPAHTGETEILRQQDLYKDLVVASAPFGSPVLPNDTQYALASAPIALSAAVTSSLFASVLICIECAIWSSCSSTRSSIGVGVSLPAITSLQPTIAHSSNSHQSASGYALCESTP